MDVPSRKRSRGKFVALVAAVLVLLGVPFYVPTYYAGVLILLFIFIILAESYDIMGGQMGYPNLGHIAFFGMGAYAFAILFKRLALGPIPTFVLAVFPVIIFAWAISYPFFRLRGFYFAVAMLGLVLLLEIVATNLREITGGFGGIYVNPGLDASTILFSSYYGSFALAVGTIYVVLRISRSKFGLALTSIREDEEVAEVFGINTVKHKRRALILSSIFAGLAGELNMWFLGIIDPRSVFGMEMALTPIVMAMLGGSGTVIGPVIGAVLLRVIQEILLPITPYFHLTAFGAALVLIGLFMPMGIAGSRRLRMISRTRQRRSTPTILASKASR